MASASGRSCRPSKRFDSTITPVMLAPALICSATAASTFGWFRKFFIEFPCEQSTMTPCRRLVRLCLARTAATFAASKLGPSFPPRSTTCVASLPLDWTMATVPCLVMLRNQWGCLAARTASMAISMSPDVPFLNPTGIERPDASSRWDWHSVVRAPMAAQHTRSERNCGVSMSRNSQAQGTPKLLMSRSSLLAMRNPSFTQKDSSR
mmetsp:Transcript_44970/g.136352  ORF Transcript_44970/g.136352 Transcript_44970/m.136352 type:complete len:207 (-) Transcript_44970:417-1037(-)